MIALMICHAHSYMYCMCVHVCVYVHVCAHKRVKVVRRHVLTMSSRGSCDTVLGGPVLMRTFSGVSICFDFFLITSHSIKKEPVSLPSSTPLHSASRPCQNYSSSAPEIHDQDEFWICPATACQIGTTLLLQLMAGKDI